MQRPLRFGLAGTGYWARTTLAPALATTPGVALTAVWGRDQAAARHLAAEHGAVAPPDFDAFLDGVDAVAFAVPPQVQAPLAIRAAAAEKAGVASVVLFTWRFDAEIRAWLADEQARGGWSGGWSGGTAIWLGTSLQPGSPFSTPWRQEKGALWDLGPHLVGTLWAGLGRVSSSATMTQGAPEAPSGAACSSGARPGGPSCPSGQAHHPCDVRFGRDIVGVLARAQAQLPGRSGTA